MPDVHVPVLGNVPKGAFIAGGIAAVGVGGYLLVKHAENKAAPSGSFAYGYGYGYGYGSNYGYGLGTAFPEEYGYGSFGYGLYDPATGQYLGSVGIPPTGTGTVAGSATNNTEWSAAAIQSLSGAGVSATTAALAIGKYLTGKPLTTNEQDIIQEAIGFEGNPPQEGTGGFPPNIRQASGGGGTGQGGGGGSSKPKKIGKRHVASGATSLNQWAKNNHTSAGEVVNTTDKNFSDKYMTAAHHARFDKYLNGGTAKKMPSGLIFFSEK